MFRSPVAAVVIVGALLALAPGCGPGTPKGPAPGGLLTIARRDSFAAFDPAFAWAPGQSPYLDLLFEGLVALDDSGRVRPACAARWEWTRNRRTVRFRLKPGIAYANGR